MRYKTYFGIGTLIFAPFVSAQATSTITMPGKGGTAYEKTMSGDYGDLLGAWADQHVQLLNGDMEGVKSLTLFTKLSFRRDMSIGFKNYGRSWKNVAINIGPHDYATKSLTYSANFFATPTQVFSAGMSWPDTLNLPPIATNPTNWGHFAKAGDMTTSFKTPFARGKNTKTDKGICVDFLFTGGALANNSGWGGRTFYYMDGIYSATAVTNFTTVALMGNSTCLATGATGRNYLVMFPQTNGVAALTNPNMFVASFGGINMPVNTNVFIVLGLAGEPWYDPKTKKWPSPGIVGPAPFNTSCNRLYVNLNLPYFLIPNKTSATGAITTAGAPLRTKYNPVYVGHRLWTQGAYWDAGKSKAELSMAGRCTIVSLPHVTKSSLLLSRGSLVNSPKAELSTIFRVNTVHLHR